MKLKAVLLAAGLALAACSPAPAPEPVVPTPAEAPELTAEAAALLLAKTPEIIIIGTGPTQVFPEAARLRPLLEARIGVEIMSTPAACRTYNVLMGEGRRVLAAICLP